MRMQIPWRVAAAPLWALSTCSTLWMSLAGTAWAQTAIPSPEPVIPAAPVVPAVPAEPALVSPAKDDNNLVVTALTETGRQARSSLEWLASRVDGWFGDIPFSDGGKVTDSEVGWNLVKRTDQPASRNFRFAARFRLPNLESHKYVFVGRDDRQDVITDQPDAVRRQQQLWRGGNQDDSFFAGIGDALLDVVDVRLGFRGGLKPYAQARYKAGWALGPNDLAQFRETVFYSRADRLGSTSVASLAHAQTPELAYRWQYVLTATQHSRDATWSSSLGAYWTLPDQRQWAWEALWTGVVGSSVTVADYGLQTRWSQPLHKDIVFGELTLGHFWPRSQGDAPRGHAWAIATDLRVRF